MPNFIKRSKPIEAIQVTESNLKFFNSPDGTSFAPGWWFIPGEGKFLSGDEFNTTYEPYEEKKKEKRGRKKKS